MESKNCSAWRARVKGRIKTEPFLYTLIGFLVVLVVLVVTVTLSESVEGCLSQLLGVRGAEGVSKKYEVLKSLVIVMGGVILIIQAYIANRRAKAMEDAAKEQAKANQNTEQGQRQERLKNAIEHLGHEKVSVRLGGAYELFHLAQDPKAAQDMPDLRQNVLDILCAHIRQTTHEGDYQKDYKSKPSEEIQSLLTLLFVQEHEVFKSCRINLQGSWLNGANLRDARLERANLTKASIRGADLSRARLQGAVLLGAWLQGTKLIRARLQKAILTGERREADVTAVRSGTDLTGVRLQGADLTSAGLQGADLSWAWLQGANLNWTELQEADLTGVRLQGVTSTITREEPSLSFEDRIRRQIGKRHDLSGVIFAGGLHQEDLNDLLEGISDEEAKEFRERLTPHIDEPRNHDLPELSGAITGKYTEQDAKQWIDEYNEAPKDIKD